MQRPETVASAPFGGTQDHPEAVAGSRSTNGSVPDDRRSAPDASGPSRRPSPSTFPKERRLRRRGEFGAVFDTGTRLHGRFFTMLLRPADGSSSRLGIVASKKLGGAVDRNRAKRLIREVFRRQIDAGRSGAVDLVVIPRRELLTAEFSQVVKDFSQTWRRGLERLSANRRG